MTSMLRATLTAILLAVAAPTLASDPCADWVPQPKPQNADRDIVGQDIDQIIDRRCTVAVENDSIADFYLTSFAGGQLSQGIRRYPTVQDAMEALTTGEVMAAMEPLAQLEFGAGEGIAIHQPPLPGFLKSKWTLGTGSHFAYRGPSYSVDDAIFAALSDGRITAIFESYGLTHQSPER
jgi:hypothetical protein